MHMHNYADRLISAIRLKGNACVVGLDPRLDLMPSFVVEAENLTQEDNVAGSIIRFHRSVLDVVSPMVPAVKLQIAFYEQYGLAGLRAFVETIRLAKERRLIVVVDAKRNDIASTADAYANAFLGMTQIEAEARPVFDVDCITVSPFLGRDSLIPFVETCVHHGKGIFILVKTSNPGSRDVQDQVLLRTGRPLYEELAAMVEELGRRAVGDQGYSSIGAVVGATFPEQAKVLRQAMPRSIFLVPGYGAQGGTAADCKVCFNADGLGAVVNASRSITYGHASRKIAETEFLELVRTRTEDMIHDVNSALQRPFEK